VAGSVAAAQSPTAHTPLWPGTSRFSVTTIRSLFFSTDKFFIAAIGVTPAAQMSVWA
jgi:hypothetical protein